MILSNILNKNSTYKDKLQIINDKLPENKQICQEILRKHNNIDTKIVEEENIKGSYYVYLNDTIYLANNKRIRNAIYRIVLIAHECRHSLQSKILQKLNFIFSNLELLVFGILFILGLLKINNAYIIISYLLILLLSLLFRFILEFDAVKYSLIISKEYIEEKITKQDADIIGKMYSFKIKLLFPIMMLQLFFGRLIRAIIIILMYKYLN